MKDVLEEIIAYKRKEIDDFKSFLPERKLHKLVEDAMEKDGIRSSMSDAIMKSDTGIIAEFKRKSPSKGWIKEDGQANEIPLSYQKNGATAVSILTDNMYFGGKDAFVQKAIESGVNIPILYKNFIIDEYQLFQARLCGASAVLLIAADLSFDECRNLLRTAHDIGLEVLLEMHSEAELEYAELEADMFGINNRNLGTFITDVQKSFSMASKLSSNVCKISESGISDAMTICKLRKEEFNGFLIGESFMHSEEPGDKLNEFINQIKTINNNAH